LPNQLMGIAFETSIE